MRQMEKEKFLIAPHMRLQEWVAEEKGYFIEEGLDFEYVDQLTKKNAKPHQDFLFDLVLRCSLRVLRNSTWFDTQTLFVVA